jgi:hypothetical protein
MTEKIKVFFINMWIFESVGSGIVDLQDLEYNEGSVTGPHLRRHWCYDVIGVYHEALCVRLTACLSFFLDAIYDVSFISSRNSFPCILRIVGAALATVGRKRLQSIPLEERGVARSW